VSELHLALAEELEKLAAGYRALAKREVNLENINIQDISIILNEKMSKGQISEIKALLKKYGAEKLAEVRLEDYAAIFKEAKKL
jgi:translation initiation factor 2 beta subunit (eIF-2beta)/eIF-5